MTLPLLLAPLKENSTEKMAPLEIHADGESFVRLPSERGVLSVLVKSEGVSQESVSSEVTSTSNHLHKLFNGLSSATRSGFSAPNAPVTAFSVTNLQTRSWFPHDEEGDDNNNNNNNNNTTRLYGAYLHFQVRFRNFEKLGDIAGTLLSTPHVEIRNITWCVTDATIKRVSLGCRKRALLDATQKARDLAGVLGRDIVAVRIVDHDCFITPRPKQRTLGTGVATIGGHVDGLTLEPEDVELAARVAVTFAAEGIVKKLLARLRVAI